jgi:hypothetical protein
VVMDEARERAPIVERDRKSLCHASGNTVSSLGIPA